MKVHYGEGLANHAAPESCVADREVRGEALTGACAGQPLSGVRLLFRSAYAIQSAEGNTIGCGIASARLAPRRRRPWHVHKPPARDLGGLHIALERRLPGRTGKAGGRSL